MTTFEHLLNPDSTSFDFQSYLRNPKSKTGQGLQVGLVWLISGKLL